MGIVKVVVVVVVVAVSHGSHSTDCHVISGTIINGFEQLPIWEGTISPLWFSSKGLDA